MRRAGALLLLTLLVPVWPPAAATVAPAPWWDPAWHFRMELELRPEGRNPASGAAVDLRGVEDALVLVPLDLRAAVADPRGPSWPVDAAGEPVGWTFLPDSVRLVASDGSLLPARWLPFRVDDGPPGEGAGTLAVALPGSFDEPRRAHLYFDVAERGEKAPAALSASAAARFAAIAGPSAGVRFLATVPPVEAGARVSLLVVPASGDAGVRAWRTTPGSAPESVLPEGATATGAARFPLPDPGLGYDLVVETSRPALVAVETREVVDAASPALAVPSLDGGFAGTRFRVPGLDGLDAAHAYDVVAPAGATIRVGDGPLVRIGRLQSVALAAPPEGFVDVQADGPVVVLARARPGAQGRTGLHAAVDAGGASSGPLLVGAGGDRHVVVADAPVTVRAFPLERPAETESGRAGDPPRLVWDAESAPEPRAYVAEGTSARATLGSDGAAAFAGDAGLSLSVPLPDEPGLAGALHAFLPPTRLEARTRAFDGSLLSSAPIDVAAGSSVRFWPDGSGAVVAGGRLVEVESDRPLALASWRPGGRATFFLPALPPVAVADAGPVEATGALLAWEQGRLVVSGRPDETVRATLRLRNLGAGSDGSPMADDVELRVEAVAGPCAGRWPASLDVARIVGLPSGSTRDLTLVVPVPADVGNACAEMSVTAVSARDPTVTAEASVVVEARSAFEPELSVVRPDGSLATAAAVVLENGTAEVPLRVLNRGAASGTAVLAVATAPGYDLDLAPDRFSLAPGEAATAVLRVAAAADAVPWQVVAEARAAENPLARDEITLSLSPRGPTDVEFHAGKARLTPTPGAADAVEVAVRNLGGDVELRFGVEGDLPEGWSARVEPARLLLRAAGSRGLDGAPLDRGNVTVQVDAPAAAPVGSLAWFAVVVRDADGRAVPGPAFTALVANDFALDARPPTDARVLPAGEVVVPVALENAGAGGFRIALRDAIATGGLRAAVVDLPPELAAGEAATIRVRVEAPPTTPAGRYAARLSLDLADSASPPARREVAFDVLVPPAAVLAADGLPASLAAPPGVEVRLPLRIRNDGNAPAERAPATESAEGLSAALLEGAFPLEPGDATAVVLSLRADASLTEGRIALVDGGRPIGELVVRAAVRDVALVELARVGGVLAVEVENRGTQRVSGLVVEVLRDAPLSRTLLPGLDPGERRRHALPVPDGPHLRVRVGAADNATDATPSDNEADLDEPGEATEGAVVAAARRFAPLPILLGVAAALLAGRLRR